MGYSKVVVEETTVFLVVTVAEVSSPRPIAIDYGANLWPSGYPVPVHNYW